MSSILPLLVHVIGVFIKVPRLVQTCSPLLHVGAHERNDAARNQHDSSPYHLRSKLKLCSLSSLDCKYILISINNNHLYLKVKLFF
jgi:hypothetical protein